MPSKCSSKYGLFLNSSHSITNLATSSGIAAIKKALNMELPMFETSLLANSAIASNGMTITRVSSAESMP